ncbi:hypothetical protein P7C73_g1323, partial [Tremellales sp. Uapishka_1]
MTPRKPSLVKVPIPKDVLLLILSFMDVPSCLGTLAVLQRCSSDTYSAVNPLLYRDFTVSHSPKTIEILSASSSSPCDERKLSSLRHVETLVVDSLPTSFNLPPRTNIFPHLKQVTFGAAAVDKIRTFVPQTYDKPISPPFIEYLLHACQPKKLELCFGRVEAEDWEEYLETTSAGAYAFVSRIQRYMEHWTNVETLVVRNVVHQVLPSLPGCANEYHFAPHLLRNPTRNVSGQAATSLPGPEYIFRIWQIVQLLKSTVSASKSANDPASITKWTFLNCSNHVLMHSAAEAWDENSLCTWETVDRLIRDGVERSLRKELPARGVGQIAVDDLLESVAWTEAAGYKRHQRPANDTRHLMDGRFGIAPAKLDGDVDEDAVDASLHMGDDAVVSSSVRFDDNEPLPPFILPTLLKPTWFCGGHFIRM